MPRMILRIDWIVREGGVIADALLLFSRCTAVNRLHNGCVETKVKAIVEEGSTLTHRLALSVDARAIG